MNLAKVVGTVVSTVKNDGIEGSRYLLLEKCNQSGEKKGNYLVALDLVGAGNDELVFVAESTSARETPITANKPVDAIIIGIIDLIDENEKIVYKK
ncbi:MAG: ethanolamine utilization protein EutN [Bacteroidetes bacterium CG02_land_8_20_14_3_00_31_25]|nr:EutN/CcmL family microcompartment protein [Bacteroidota bacterium]PIV58332.1 MAG: ethanolamine utilization protein EutN [Bacteroidetes bacterium CG02_land_8_20_14_3_00_31_25]PIX34189.1 MAG: ethanolamine utilization protein EutN [Bacteroidetes bacterium CG_4_8_14_3_um_filter_31_14]PIY04852.1 MAG: ethanolamine utilization protein EutN [Bacteroidetes bacterium CG_4_10_14_3_um_filter_31_20]